MSRMVRRGDIPAYCELCLNYLPLSALRKAEPLPHKCPKASSGLTAHVVVKVQHVEEYDVMASRQTSGRLGGLAAAQKRKAKA